MMASTVMEFSMNSRCHPHSSHLFASTTQLALRMQEDWCLLRMLQRACRLLGCLLQAGPALPAKQGRR